MTLSAGQFDPSIGRDSKSQELAASDLTVEELMASGADVDMLIDAGVVDGGEKDEDIFYGEVLPGAGEYKGGPEPSKEEFEALLKKFDQTFG